MERMGRERERKGAGERNGKENRERGRVRGMGVEE